MNQYRVVYNLRFSDNQPQDLAMVFHLILGKEDLAKHLSATGLGYVIRTCRQRADHDQLGMTAYALSWLSGYQSQQTLLSRTSRTCKKDRASHQIGGNVGEGLGPMWA